ncbi:uncharacterized membrane protein YcaP (DUF421 family) [Salirhabdus euzebyi]|uniref:Uncharacterized membrane protein YcaP (DUF421 family) n=1 Tax=Salirhabdus euzebyi TaxID=394506 RepID=A0A841Q4Q5_9BACI|nr:YetF domain-containing protein [Salirhabdus euzebyi]MBB6453330.1 uncharacterized membrane protein YcaP (DUF421 family) [Salirhabdus euzebyi]
MLLEIGKLVVVYLFFVISIRLLGKTALAQLTPHDFGALFFLAYIAFGAINLENFSQAIAGIGAIIATHLLLSRLTLINKMNKFIVGAPLILIKHGKLYPEHLKKSRYPLVELLSSLRLAGYPRIESIEYAILEPNGEISVLPKTENAPVRIGDLNIQAESNRLPLSVVVEGKVQKNNLEEIEKDEDWLQKELEQKGYTNVKNIFFATVTTGSKNVLHVYDK